MASKIRTVAVTNAFVPFASLAAKRVSILNNTGASIQIRMVADPDSGSIMTLKDGQPVKLELDSNAAEVAIKADSGAPGVELVFDV